MRITFVSILVLCFSSGAFAQSAEEIFNRAAQRDQVALAQNFSLESKDLQHLLGDEGYDFHDFSQEVVNGENYVFSPDTICKIQMVFSQENSIFRMLTRDFSLKPSVACLPR
jgi:hypothetical protein